MSAYLGCAQRTPDSLLLAQSTPITRYNDSLLIYTTYRTQITELDSLKLTDLARWHEREMHDDSITACAKNRLRAYNGTSYQPTTEHNREAIGVAYAYPAPARIMSDAYFIPDRQTYRFSIIDEQTRFATDSCGRRIPYITRTFFNEGRMMHQERLNPITYAILARN